MDSPKGQGNKRVVQEQKGQVEEMITNTHALYVQRNLPLRDKLEQVAEEASELAQAALKLIRAGGWSANATPTGEKTASDNFHEEVRDLMCVLRVTLSESKWQDITAIDDYAKFERWAKRLGYED